MKSDALIIHKHDASTVLKRLKDADIVDRDKRVDQEDDKVLIAIKSTEVSNLLQDIEFEVGLHEFEIIQKPPGSLKEALRELLPEVDEEMYQTSYDQIGTIAIIDLNDELVPNAHTVGKAILASNNSIQTVFRKSTKVDGLLRLPGLELIGGEYQTQTVHKEHGLRIKVDVEKAYFSPRLATEHHRVAKQIEEGSRVLDMFGSLAPFALHITNNKNVEVDTLDINPHVPELIMESIQMNRLQGTISIICEDAHQFAESNESDVYDYILMNHPSGAFDFLADAIKLVKPTGRIYYYDFIEIDNYKELITEKLKPFGTMGISDIHIVRQSSPSEYHVCVTLTADKPD